MVIKSLCASFAAPCRQQNEAGNVCYQTGQAANECFDILSNGYYVNSVLLLPHPQAVNALHGASSGSDHLSHVSETL